MSETPQSKPAHPDDRPDTLDGAVTLTHDGTQLKIEVNCISTILVPDGVLAESEEDEGANTAIVIADMLVERMTFDIETDLRDSIRHKYLAYRRAHMMSAKVPDHWDAQGEPLPGNPLLDAPTQHTEDPDNGEDL
jgi:hypothetical protein